VAYDVDVSECTEKRDLVEKLHARGVNADTAGAPPPPTKKQGGGGGGGGNNNASNNSSGTSSNSANSNSHGDSGDAAREKEAKAMEDTRLQSQRAAKLIQVSPL